MAELKTKETKNSVSAFIRKLPAERRKDAEEILAIMEAATKEKPAMWGTSIVGFGRMRYKYESGREGDWFKAGFSPRKDAFTFYLSGGFAPHAELMAKLGKHKTGKGCVYVKKLEDIDTKVFKQLITQTMKRVKSVTPGQA